jgi:hypothetical protein
MPAFRSVVSVLVSFVGRSFSTNSRPPGQSLQLASVSYTNVAITDTTNGVTEPIPGTFSSGCLLPNVRGAC